MTAIPAPPAPKKGTPLANAPTKNYVKAVGYPVCRRIDTNIYRQKTRKTARMKAHGIQPGTRMNRLSREDDAMPARRTPIAGPGNSGKGSEFAAPRDPQGAKDTVAVALGKTAATGESVPRVLATGRGEFAETILDIAFRNGIRVREDSDLAEILAAVDLDSEIPVEAFIAVAEILRYVYANNDPTADYLEQMARGSSTKAAREDDDDGAKDGNPE